ncbi:MAG: VOC family protein [Rikenellaceae bacterium]
MNIAKQIDHINMVVPNLEGALAWYTQNLGFKVTGRFSQGGFEILYLSNGSISYEMFENPSLKAPIADHIAYCSDDIEADHAYYVAQGLQVS